MGAGWIRQREGESEQELLLVPPHDDPKNPLRPLPIALWVHGASGQEYEPLAWSHVHMIANAGFIVVSADWASAYHWGNDEAITQINEVIADLRATGYANDDPIITIGQSMGNVGSLNWALQNPDDWKGHINLVGVWDVDQIHSENRWSLRAGIDLAYGGSWANFNEKDEHSPARYITQLKPVPMYIVHGTADTAAVESETQTAITNWPGKVTDIRVLNGTHANTSEQADRILLKEWIDAFRFGTDEEPDDGGFEILTRSDWGADESIMAWEPQFYPIQKITIHHTDTANNNSNPENTIRNIYEDHVNDRGFGDVAYHYFIDESGRVFQGRYTGGGDAYNPSNPDEIVTAAHTSGWNSGNLGIALLGSFVSEDPTPEAMHTLRLLLSNITMRHDIDPEGISDFINPANDEVAANMPNISSHRDWPGTATECPGDEFYNNLPKLRIDITTLNDGGTVEPPPEPETPESYVAIERAVYPERLSAVGPLEINDGLYVFMLSGDTDLGDVRAYKSEDGGASWFSLGYWNKGADPIRSLAVDVDEGNNLVRVLTQDSGGYTAYKVFDLAADGWSSFGSQAWQPSATVQGVALVARSDGSAVATYQGSPSGGFEVLNYAIRDTTGTWNHGNMSSISADVYNAGGVLGANDLSHFFYVSEENLYHRTINSSGTVGSEQIIATDVANIDLPTTQPKFDGSSVHISYVNTEGGLVHLTADSDVSPTWSESGPFSYGVRIDNDFVVADSTLADGTVESIQANNDGSLWYKGANLLSNATVNRMAVTHAGDQLMVLVNNNGEVGFFTTPVRESSFSTLPAALPLTLA